MSVTRYPPSQEELNPRSTSPSSTPYRSPSTQYAPLPAIGPAWGAATGREMVPYASANGTPNHSYQTTSPPVLLCANEKNSDREHTHTHTRSADGLEAVFEERFRQLELRLNIQEKSGRALLDILIQQQSSMKQQVTHIEAALSVQRQVRCVKIGD